MQQIYWRTPEIALQCRCSPVNLLHIFRTPFPNNTSEGLLLQSSTFTNKAKNYYNLICYSKFHVGNYAKTFSQKPNMIYKPNVEIGFLKYNWRQYFLSYLFWCLHFDVSSDFFPLVSCCMYKCQFVSSFKHNVVINRVT